MRVLFVAWFLREERRWLGEFLPPERFERSYVGMEEPDLQPRRQPLEVDGNGAALELWVKRAEHDGSDWVRTRQLIGTRRGVLRPEEQLLISPRLYRLLLELKIKRFEVEVAHWA